VTIIIADFVVMREEVCEGEYRLTEGGNISRLPPLSLDQRRDCDIPQTKNFGRPSLQEAMKTGVSNMKKLVLGALFGLLAACGGGKSGTDAIIVVVDGGDAAPATCNVLADSGCVGTEKCTWIIDVNTGMDRTGHVGCAAPGPKALGESCMIGTGGAMAIGSDNCAKGLFCLGGVCKTVCDPAGVSPKCGAGLACANYSQVFGNAGEAAVAGVCDPTCNVLTQKNDATPPVDDCGGGKDPNGKPRLGCYGFWASNNRSRFSCSPNINPGFEQGKLFAPNAAFINSCAPGYFSLIFEKTGSMSTICSAHCAVGDVYKENGANPDRGGKQVAGMTTTCAQRRAIDVKFDCIAGRVFEVDRTAMTLTVTKYSDLGVCIDGSKFPSTSTPPTPDQCVDMTKGTDEASDVAYANGCRNTAVYRPLPTTIGGAPPSITVPVLKLADAAKYMHASYPMVLSAE
jgi:hypothetical protein